MMTKIITRVIKQSSVCGWFTRLTLSAAAPWVLLRQGTTALKRKISCKFNMRRSPGSWKTISTSINIQQLHQGWSPASPSLSAALELLSPVPALPWQFLQHFPFSETASPFTGMEILKYNIMMSWDITCQVTLTVQDAGLREGFLGHWSQFWAPRGSDRIHTWVRAGNIHHTFTQAHPTSTEILPLSIHCGYLSSASWKRRGGGLIQAPGRKGCWMKRPRWVQKVLLVLMVLFISFTGWNLCQFIAQKHLTLKLH